MESIKYIRDESMTRLEKNMSGTIGSQKNINKDIEAVVS